MEQRKLFPRNFSIRRFFFIIIKLGFCACLNGACRYVAVSLLLQEAGTLDQSKALSVLLRYTCNATVRVSFCST